MPSTDAFARLQDLVDPAALPPSIIALADAAQLAYLLVLDRGVSHTPLGSVFSFVLAFEQELTFDVPMLPLTIVLGPAASDSIAVRALLDDEWFIEVDRLTATLRFDPVLLRPVDPARQFAEVRVESGLRLTKEEFRFTEPGLRLTLPPSEIPGTGIVVAIDGIAFDWSTEHTPPVLTELGYDAAFQGVFAEQASVRLFPFLRIGDGAAGLTLTARDIVIGTSGFSCRVEHSFPVDRDSFTGEAVGGFGEQGWPIALTSVEGEIRDNDPTALRASGLLRLPVFALPFEFDLAVERGDAGDVRYSAALASAAPATIETPFGSVQYDEILFDAALDDTSFEASGVLTGLVIDLDPLALSVDSATVRILHRLDRDEFAVTLRDVELGPLGQLESADLVIEERPGPSRSVRVEAVLSWAELRSRIQVPDYLPMPPDDGRVQVLITWLDDEATGERRMQLTLRATLDDVDSLWAFVPQAARPEVRHAALTLEVTYASTDEFSSESDDSTLAGSFGASFELRLPPLGAFPGADLLTVTTGGADGWIRVAVDTSIDADGRAAASARIEDLVTVDIQLPALPQPQPPVHLALTSAAFRIATDTSAGGSDTSGTVTLGGQFDLRPIAPPPIVPFASHLASLLAPIQPGRLSGQATLALSFTADGASMALECVFDDASVTVDVFDLLANLASGIPTPAVAQPSQGEIDLDLEIGFALRHFALALDTAGGDGPGFSTEIGLTVSVGPVSVDGHIRLSDQEAAIGISEIAIPMSVPAFPLTHADIAALQTDADWQGALTTRRQRIAELGSLADALTNPELAELRAEEFLLTYLQEIRQRLSGPPNRQTYQAGIETIVGMLEVVSGLTHSDSTIELVVKDVQFVLPIGDPRDIRVEGSAHLRGFAADDPFKVLEGVTLGLGLSADRIFFSTASIGGPIPIPDFGRYPGGHVNLSRFTIGYGYTKNSFSLTFQGDIKLPQQLVEDADTSDVIGFGVRLPRHSSLNFKLDLIPLPGPIPVVPLIEFDLDLRSPAAPGILATETCQPFWDGVQLHVPGVFRAGVERVAVAPLLGMLPIPNARFAGDLQIGDEKNGLTVIADNMHFLIGLSAGSSTLVIPFVVDGVYPYFDNFCVNLRFAGIGINFDIQRPFPSLSPLALFEVMGLISDPMMPIDPDGALANSLRVSLVDGRLTLPPEIVRMFPEARSYANKRVEMTLNVGTVMSGLQEVMRTAGELAAAVERGSADLARRLDRLAANPPSLRVADLVGLLPPELRKVRLGGSFAGFEARAVLVIMDANDIDALVELFERRGAAGPDTVPAMALGSTVDVRQASGFRPNLPPRPGRTFDPSDPDANVFQGREFSSFSPDDLRAMPAPRHAQAGVIVAAHVKVFEAQRFHFLGALYEDGSFGLVTGLDVKPLELRVAGIAVRVPLRASGRLRLSGRARRDRVRATIEAEVTVTGWHAIPGILRLDIGVKKPVTLRLTSDGRFSFDGDASATLFGGRGVIDGHVSVSHTHCLIEGHFDYALGAIALGIDGRGRVGPGATFELAGAGSLVVGDVPFADVKGRLTERSARVEGRLNTGTWSLGGVTLPCAFTMEAAGEIDLAATVRPRFLLEGDAELTVFDATVRGRGHLSTTQSGQVRARLEGSLLWQGREWLGGRIQLLGSAVTIAGRTSLAFNLTPANFAGVDVANLFFKLDIEGEFSLDATGGLSAFARVKGDWMLAVQFPNADSNSAMRRQAFPLAMRSFSVGAGVSLEKKLLEIRSMRLLPFDIQLPQLEVTSDLPLRFHRHGVEIPGVGGIRILIPEFPGVHTPSLDPDPFPFPVASDVADNWSTMATIPTSFGFSDDVLALPSSLDFDVYLVWQDGKLAVDIREV